MDCAFFRWRGLDLATAVIVCLRRELPSKQRSFVAFTSLPGRFGIGDLGPCAYEFADFLFAAGQKLWQVLPLNPTGYGDSPYQCFSAFAGNPLLLSLERLRDQGLLQASDLARRRRFPTTRSTLERSFSSR